VDNNRADGHLASLRGEAGFGERELHEVNVRHQP
jgi:hypothetical protein